MEIKIPFLAEGVESGTVVSILVKEGDRIEKDQTVLELETNKATAPIPSPGAGTVTKILVHEGEEVGVGQTIMVLSEGAGSKAKLQKGRSKAAVPREKPLREMPADVSKSYMEGRRRQAQAGLPPPTSPSVRKIAHELGVDLSEVEGTEPGGRISLADVRRYVQSPRTAKPGAPTQPKAQRRIDFSKWGPVTRKVLSNIRQTIGQRMYEAWSNIPHVTQFEEADITNLMVLRQKYASVYEKEGGRLTLTALVLKVLPWLLRKYPVFNSSYDETAKEIVYKDYYHIGVAVDTEQGLIVPVVRDVDKKDLMTLAKELECLAEKARKRTLLLNDIEGGTFTVSNLGSIGGAHFSPIINPPQVAILGLGRARAKPVAKTSKIQIRTMLPICLSYDHRVIDGADGARFIEDFVQALEQVGGADVKLSSQPKKISGKKSKG